MARLRRDELMVAQQLVDPRVRGETGTAVEASVVHGVLQRHYGFLESYQAVRPRQAFSRICGHRFSRIGGHRFRPNGDHPAPCCLPLHQVPLAHLHGGRAVAAFGRNLTPRNPTPRQAPRPRAGSHDAP
jgi:hypothetical protein